MPKKKIRIKVNVAPIVGKIAPDTRSPLARARDDFFSSAEGVRLFSSAEGVRLLRDSVMGGLQNDHREHDRGG